MLCIFSPYYKNVFLPKAPIYLFYTLQTRPSTVRPSTMPNPLARGGGSVLGRQRSKLSTASTVGFSLDAECTPQGGAAVLEPYTRLSLLPSLDSRVLHEKFKLRKKKTEPKVRQARVEKSVAPTQEFSKIPSSPPAFNTTTSTKTLTTITITTPTTTTTTTNTTTITTTTTSTRTTTSTSTTSTTSTTITITKSSLPFKMVHRIVPRFLRFRY